MAVRISARLAWHMDGWNEHVCKNPAANTYCIGHGARYEKVVISFKQ